ncbi:MAG: S24 family peptidase [Eubacteriaceae bacterium]|jgi:repressor LexA|nr:S24 family peptidase [Eubacteriaceae bacterium]
MKEQITDSENYFSLRMKGDSMYPKYQDGDILILKKASACKSGDDCAVHVNGKGTVSKVIKRGSCTMLVPYNTAYEPTIIEDDCHFSILGVVKQLQRNIKKTEQ